MDEPNILSQIVQYIPAKLFKLVQNLTLYPKLSHSDLKEISQGSYQIKLAKSYCQLHMKTNQNTFPLYVCDNVCKRYFEKKIVLGPNPLLVSINLRSRFESQKIHKTYVLLDLSDEKYEVKGYCCSCRHGCRTVGCCGHTMLVIWYILHIDQNNVKFPSSNFDHLLDNWNNPVVEPESEDEPATEGNTESDLNSNSNED